LKLVIKANRSIVEPFAIKDCTLIAIATGKKAQNLRELKDHLGIIEPNSIYYHFWGGLLRPRFDDPEYHNDFAIRIAHSLHDKILAERLAVIDPVEFETLEDLRNKLIETIDESLDETEFPSWAKRDGQFEFMGYLLHNQDIMKEMGWKAKEFVRENFLITRHLREYLTLIYALLHGKEERIELS
jgi:hypothetical protein